MEGNGCDSSAINVFYTLLKAIREGRGGVKEVIVDFILEDKRVMSEFLAGYNGASEEDKEFVLENCPYLHLLPEEA